jgi:alanine-glyoxylate transaminase / serine-glyoxylate transaminase / serine-pyruvate transaminase
VIEEEGLEARWERHRAANVHLLRGLATLGFEPLVEKAEDRIWHLTTVKPPAGVDEAALRQQLFDRYDIEVASGLGQLAGKILRIGTMGPLATDERVDHLLESIEAVLN